MEKRKQNDRNRISEDLKNKGKGKFLKSLVSAMVLSALSIGYLEDVRARLDAVVLGGIPAIVLALPGFTAAVGPIPAAFVAPADGALATCNVHLANIIAQAIFIIPGIAGGNPPANGQDCIAAATLIVAAKRAVISAGGAAVGGLSPSAINAVQAYNIATGGAFGVAIAGGADLGTDFVNTISVVPYLQANAVAAATQLIRAFIAGAGVAGGLAVPAVNSALNLWEHMVERGHLWQIPMAVAAVPNINIDLHYLTWNRAARVGTAGDGRLPASHTSFLIPPGVGPAAHFRNILAAADTNMAAAVAAAAPPAVVASVCISRMNALIGGAIGVAPAVANGHGRVNIHLNIAAAVAAGVVPGPVSGVIKSNLGGEPGGPGVAATGLNNAGVVRFLGRSISGGPFATNADESLSTLLEAISAKNRIGNAIIANGWGNLNPAFSPLLTGGPVANASAAQPVGIVTICVNLSHPGGIGTMFAE
jgi:hypothetical protein